MHSRPPTPADQWRNFPADTDPATGRIFKAGGYDSTKLPSRETEIFTPGVACATPTSVPAGVQVSGLEASPAGGSTGDSTGLWLLAGLLMVLLVIGLARQQVHAKR